MTSKKLRSIWPLTQESRDRRQVSMYPRACEALVTPQDEVTPDWGPEHPLVAASRTLGIDLPRELTPAGVNAFGPAGCSTMRLDDKTKGLIYHKTKGVVIRVGSLGDTVEEAFILCTGQLNHLRRRYAKSVARREARLHRAKVELAAAIAERDRTDAELEGCEEAVADVWGELCQLNENRQREHAEWEKKATAARAEWGKRLAEEKERVQKALNFGVLQRERMEEIKDMQIKDLEETLTEASERRKVAEEGVQRLKNKLEESEERALQMEAQAREELVQVVEEKFQLRDRVRELETELKACKEKLEAQKDSALQSEALAREEMVRLMDDKFEERSRVKLLEDQLSVSKSTEVTKRGELRKAQEELEALKRERVCALRRLDHLVLLGQRLSWTMDAHSLRPAQAQQERLERLREPLPLSQDHQCHDTQDSALHLNESGTLTESTAVNSVKDTGARRVCKENICNT